MILKLRTLKEKKNTDSKQMSMGVFINWYLHEVRVTEINFTHLYIFLCKVQNGLLNWCSLRS